MGVKFKDYYETLGVARTATPEEIRRAYRQLARKHHPDVNKGEKASEDKFKEVNEAYEVLKDPEKRQRYDALGANWKHGQEFRPHPGQGGGFSGGFAGGFGGSSRSDFFESIFGDLFGGRRAQARSAANPFEDGGYSFEEASAPEEYIVEVPISTVLSGGTVKVALSGGRSFDIRVPKGIAEGKKIRLSGEGAGGGDILLKIAYRMDGPWRKEGDNMVMDLRVTPAQAALGDRLPVETPQGQISISIPPGTSSGRRLRLRGHGFPRAGADPGDLLVQVMIHIPDKLTDLQRELYQKLADSEKS